MKKIYGNKYLLSTLASMFEHDRAAQSVIFYGEPSSGRRLMAEYYTLSLMCESPESGRPCGKCRSCRNVERKFHPDVTYVGTSGKLGGYSVETARAIISDSYIKPNNQNGKKVYIFADCRNVDPRTQNALLKLIEEPPEYAYFLFTCEAKTDLLPTIVSRCVSFGVSPCTENEARESLAESGFSQSEINAAVSCFHGNIGLCTKYITDESVRKQVDLTKSLANSIISRDEYSLNVNFFTLGRERSDVRSVLSMLDKLIRDAAVLGKDVNAPAISCFRDGALKLSQSITAYQAARIHHRIERAKDAVNQNVNIPLALAALCAEIIEIV